MVLESWLAKAAREFPESVAVSDCFGQLSYSELHQLSLRTAQALKAQGVRTGERVAVALPRDRNYLATMYGCWFLGAAPILLDERLTAEELEYRAGGSLLLTEPLQLEGPLPDPVLSHSSDQTATVLYTSGSSGPAKVVELTFGNWQASTAACVDRLSVDRSDNWLCAIPISHVSGLGIVLRACIVGFTVTLHQRFDVEQVKQVIESGEVTAISVVPTMLVRLLDAGLSGPGNLRFLLVGGAPVSDELIERAQQAQLPIAITYGKTEVSAQATVSDPDDPRNVRAVLGVSVELAADGEIKIAGPTVAPAYIADDGWHYSGDLGTLTSAGVLSITGRKSNLIITGGENVLPEEVETVLLELPEIAAAAVYARPDREWGETVNALVIPSNGNQIDLEELKARLREKLAGYKVPKRIELVTELPLLPSGKLDRAALRTLNS